VKSINLRCVLLFLAIFILDSLGVPGFGIGKFSLAPFRSSFCNIRQYIGGNKKKVGVGALALTVVAIGGFCLFSKKHQKGLQGDVNKENEKEIKKENKDFQLELPLKEAFWENIGEDKVKAGLKVLFIALLGKDKLFEDANFGDTEMVKIFKKKISSCVDYDVKSFNDIGSVQKKANEDFQAYYNEMLKLLKSEYEEKSKAFVLQENKLKADREHLSQQLKEKTDLVESQRILLESQPKLLEKQEV
jgi:hypothetical protein